MVKVYQDIKTNMIVIEKLNLPAFMPTDLYAYDQDGLITIKSSFNNDRIVIEKYAHTLFVDKNSISQSSTLSGIITWLNNIFDGNVYPNPLVVNDAQLSLTDVYSSQKVEDRIDDHVGNEDFNYSNYFSDLLL